MKYFNNYALFIIATCTLISFQPLYGDEHPRWEAGIGIGSITVPQYLGSDESSTMSIPIPYFVYESEKINIDRSGLKGILGNWQRFSLEVSGALSLAVDSHENRARAGMPDLKPVFELGPSLEYLISRNVADNDELRFELPVRAAFNIRSKKLHFQGWTSQLSLVYAKTYEQWKWSSSLDAIFSDKKYHEYYYNVNNEYVTATRPYYEAAAGYTGTRISSGISRRFKNWYFGAFVRYHNISHAENVHSPLIQTNHNITAGMMLAWIFKKSP